MIDGDVSSYNVTCNMRDGDYVTVCPTMKHQDRFTFKPKELIRAKTMPSKMQCAKV